MPARTRSAVTGALVALVVALVATGCDSGLGGTGDKGYIDGKGVVTVLPDAKRVEPGEVSGETLDGDEVDLADYAGKVVVVNVWGSWCGPCRDEADDLVAAAKELMPTGVVFLGINTRDNSADTARAFERSRNVPYPSIFDPGGSTLLAFHRTLSPNSIPSTVVIDSDGRVAASILGRVPTARTLVDLVEEVTGS